MLRIAASHGFSKLTKNVSIQQALAAYGESEVSCTNFTGSLQGGGTQRTAQVMLREDSISESAVSVCHSVA